MHTENERHKLQTAIDRERREWVLDGWTRLRDDLLGFHLWCLPSGGCGHFGGRGAEYAELSEARSNDFHRAIHELTAEAVGNGNRD